MSEQKGGPASAGPPLMGPAPKDGARERYDAHECHCPMLGHSIRFAYCRAATRGLPCARIADCWFERVPIEDFLHCHYTTRELGAVFAPRPGKLESILDIVERVSCSRPPS